MTPQDCVRSVLRAPAFHFAAAGALLFAVAGWHGAERDTAAPEPIVVSAVHVERLIDAYERGTGRRATSEDARALVERAVEEEVLYREALAFGLHRDDPGVAWRMIEKMTFLSDDDAPPRREMLGQAIGLGLDREDPVVRRLMIEKMRLALKHGGSAGAPTRAELEAWLERHRDRFAQPPRVRLTQVVLSGERHGPSLARDAAELLGDLRRTASSAEDAVRRSDPFPTELLAVPATERELAVRFGAAVARAAFSLEPGTWSEPVASPFGLHLLFVHERLPGRVPQLAEIEGPVRYGLEAERREAALAAGLRTLRARYEVRIDWPARMASAVPAARP